MAVGSEPIKTGRKIGLTIAGFDPSAGAGITADLKVFEAHGIYGMAAITALTVQSTLGVRRTEPVSPGLLRETLDCLSDDVSFAGVKIGMLATGHNVRAVSLWLGGGVREDRNGVLSDRTAPGASPGPMKVVFDPVLKSSSGAALLNSAGIDGIRTELLSRVGWITPNWAELGVLSGIEVRGREDLPPAIRCLQGMAGSLGNFSLNVVATGGDQSDTDLGHSNDLLVTPAGEQFWLVGDRVNTTSTHGTGCTFSTALLCELIAGKDPWTACTAAKAYVSRALEAAYAIGQGRGPLHPFV